MLIDIEEQAAEAEANVVVLQQRVREVERERETLNGDAVACALPGD